MYSSLSPYNDVSEYIYTYIYIYIYIHTYIHMYIFVLLLLPQKSAKYKSDQSCLQPIISGDRLGDDRSVLVPVQTGNL